MVRLKNKHKTLMGLGFAILFVLAYWFLTNRYGEPAWVKYPLMFMAGLGLWKLIDLSRIIKIKIHIHEDESPVQQKDDYITL